MRLALASFRVYIFVRGLLWDFRRQSSQELRSDRQKPESTRKRTAEELAQVGDRTVSLGNSPMF